MPRIRAGQLFAVTLVTVGCAATPQRQPDAQKAASTASMEPRAEKSSASASAKPDGGTASARKGLADPANDAAVVTLAREVLSCDWRWGAILDFMVGGDEKACSAIKTWRMSPVVRSGEAAPTLVNFLDDSDLRTRALGVASLLNESAPLKRYRADPVLASRVLDHALAVTGAEEGPFGTSDFGMLVGYVDAEATKSHDRLESILSHPRQRAFLMAFVGVLPRENPDDEAVFELMKTFVVGTASVEVRAHATAAFIPTTKLETKICAFLAEQTQSPTAEIVDAAATALTRTEAVCSLRYEDVIALGERRRVARTLTSNLVTAIAVIAQERHKKTSTTQRKRVLAFLHTVALDSDPAAWKTPETRAVRTQALVEIYYLDHAEGKVVAAKLAKDPSDAMRSAAAEVLGR